MSLPRFSGLVSGLLFGASVIAQAYNDTLYFESGLNKACEIIRYDNKKIIYTYTTPDGEQVYPTLRADEFWYFEIYDSLGVLTYSSQHTLRDVVFNRKENSTDSSYKMSHLFSLNPISLGVLGLDFGYTWRFGHDLKYGLHVPVHFSSPLLFEYKGFFYSGIGFMYFLINELRYSASVGFIPSFYMLSDVNMLGLPLTIGFVRHLNPLIGVDGYVGLGPGISADAVTVLPIWHIGLNVQLTQVRKESRPKKL